MKTFINGLWYCWVAAGIVFICFLVYHTYTAYMENQFLAKLSAAEIEDFTSRQNKDFGTPPDLDAVLILDGEISDRSIAETKRYYQAVPWQIRKAFLVDGWKLVITDRDISSTYYNGSVKGELAGLTDSRSKRIYIHEKRNHIRNALLHEFGHFLDLHRGYLSATEPIKTCFQREKKAFDGLWKTDDHAMSNKAEFFAESFQQYILNPEACKTRQPLTYKYLYSLMEK